MFSQKPIKKREVIIMFSQKPAIWSQVIGVGFPLTIVLGLYILYQQPSRSLPYLVALFYGVWFLFNSKYCHGARDWMNTIWEQIQDADFKRTSLTALGSTVVFSFAAHGFLFANEFFSHDAIDTWAYGKLNSGYTTVLGRFMLPLYETIKGKVTAPWLIGLLFIVWISLTVIVLCRLLKIQDTWGIVLTSGLLCTNIALTLTAASYTFCFDDYTLALFLSVLAAYLFERGWCGALPGIVVMILSLGLYQPYFTVTISVCFFVGIRKLLENQRVARVIADGIRDFVLLVVSYLFYEQILKIICARLNIERIRLGSVRTFESLGEVYALLRSININYVLEQLDGTGVLGAWMPAAHILLCLFLLYRLVDVLINPELITKNKILLCIFLILVPTVLNTVSILLYGVHQLMRFSSELWYVLAVFCWIGPKPKKKLFPVQGAVVLLLCCILWQHVVYANQVYMKKELEKNSTMVIATRIIDSVESLDGYIFGETPVVLSGLLMHNENLDRDRAPFVPLQDDVGLAENVAATYNLWRYLTAYLNYPLIGGNEASFSAEERAVLEEMPVYPQPGSVRMIGDAAVIKIS